MQLRELISETSVLEVHGSTAVEIAGISYDARRVLPGDLYVPIQREGADGHGDIEIAIERGAVAVVCRRGGSFRQRVTRIEVPDTRVALAELSDVFYGRAGEKLHVIAVAGGAQGWKTAHLTKQILQAAGVKTGLICSMRHEIGERRLPAGQLLEASDIQRLFQGMVRTGCSACVLELPAISPAYLKGIPVNVLLFEGGEQNLRALALFLQTRTHTPVCGIVNVDHEEGRSVAHSNLFKMQLAYGLHSSAEVSASELACSTGGSRFLLNLAGHTAVCEVPLVGRQNVRHLLGAAAASLSTLTPRQVLKCFAGVRSVPAALEAIPNQQGLSLFVDEAALPETLHGVLNELTQIKSGRLLLAVGAAAGTAGKHRFDLGRTAAQFADHVILTSDNPGAENPEKICAVMAQGFESVGRGRYHIQTDRAQAIRELIAMAEPGDVVLIAGKGDRAHQVLADTVVPFDDREISVEFLQNFVKSVVRTMPEPALCAA
jgi:UDP-N-acetylmuramoyl-L-alanyl-D-glutamate--2,6-diaminopimelate ligase